MKAKYMESNILSLKPESLWYQFARLCEIPRPSKKETQVLAYIENVAKTLGLPYKKDQVGNIVISKPATKGKEHVKTLILQSHVDMVPQKNNDKVHDFSKDPIIPMVDGDWVKADKTTLGADNGIGAAAMLAILENKELEHGPIEALFTIDEETGMTGAFNLSEGFLNGRMMLNLDSEEDGVICLGCAGGLDANIKFHYIEEAVPGHSIAYELTVKGLKGGHSGIDIHKGLGNAIKILNRLLWQASKDFGIRLASMKGGSLRNAIPREASAIITMDQGMQSEFEKDFADKVAGIKNEFLANEPGLTILLEPTEQPYTLIYEDVQHKLLNAIYACPNGVIGMDKKIPGVVETSTNLAFVGMENGELMVQCLLRSSVDTAKWDLANMVDSVFNLAGADVSFEGEYPGWEPDFDSQLLKTVQSVFKNQKGSEAETEVIHAGLECGIIGAKYPGMQMVSCGPTIHGAHSPDERVHIQSVANFWDLLVNVLKSIQ
jgi:dipeptidase D